jgi:hypothetical protein
MRILSHLNSQYLCYLHIILSSAQLIEMATMIDHSLIRCGDTSVLYPCTHRSRSNKNNNHHNHNNTQHSTAAAAAAAAAITLCPSMEDVVRDPLLFSRCVSIVHLVSMCSATSMTITHTSTNYYNDNGDDDNDISPSAPSRSSNHYHKHTYNSHYTGHNSSEFYLQEISSYRQQCRDIIKELQLHFHKYISTFGSNSSNNNSSRSNNGRNGRRRQQHRGKRKKSRNNNGVVGRESISRLDLVALYTAFLVGCNKRNKVSAYNKYIRYDRKILC